MMITHSTLPCIALSVCLTSCLIGIPGVGGTGGGAAPPKVYCVKDRASGACQCSTTDPGLGSDTDYVSNCDSLPADTQCCHDINGDGQTTFCECQRLLCAYDTDTDRCECRFYDVLLVGNNRDNETIVSTCPTTSCCRGSETCRCGNGPQNCFSDTPVSACTVAQVPSRRSCSGGSRWAASCAGLKWTK